MIYRYVAAQILNKIEFCSGYMQNGTEYVKCFLKCEKEDV
jgi:hypothetical protein